MTTEIQSICNSIRLFIAVAAVVAFAAGIGTAFADQSSDVLRTKVSYGDLDLNSQQGAKVLYARLRFAARQVCIPLESIELDRQHAWHECVDNALNSAVASVNKASVTALHNQAGTRANQS
jgi:UrcA family protein